MFGERHKFYKFTKCQSLIQIFPLQLKKFFNHLYGFLRVRSIWDKTCLVPFMFSGLYKIFYNQRLFTKTGDGFRNFFQTKILVNFYKNRMWCEAINKWITFKEIMTIFIFSR